jgi:hypothetical protein
LNEHGISCAQRNGLVDFAHLRDKNKLLRMWLMLRHGYFKQSRIQTLKWMIRI